MTELEPGRVKELTEAFEFVLSYVQQVYGLEYSRPIGNIAMGLVGYVKEEPIEVGENRLSDQVSQRFYSYRCSMCKIEFYGTCRPRWDKTGGLHVVCERCSDALEQIYGQDGEVDSVHFK